MEREKGGEDDEDNGGKGIDGDSDQRQPWEP